MGQRVRLLGLSLISATTALAQFDAPRLSYRTDVDYDGRFTFVRLQWRSDGRSRRGWSSAWDHDYPRAEQHLSSILKELTYLDIRTDGRRILTLDDAELSSTRSHLCGSRGSGS